jgi:glycerol-3-phosphate acyltransferase PlsY
MAIVVGVFVVLLVTVRIVSIASIAATVMYPVMAVVFKEPLAYIIGACIMSTVVLWAHRGNFRRIYKGQEPRVKFPWNKRTAEPTTS